MVLCHGLGSSKNGFHLPALAHALAAKGLSSLRLDFSGCGESEGPFRYANHHEEVTSENSATCALHGRYFCLLLLALFEMSSMQQADEIETAKSFLAGRGKKVTAVLGHSKGGSSILLHCATYQNVPKAVNVSGRFNHKEGQHLLSY